MKTNTLNRQFLLIVQVRINSTRLPEKAILPLGNFLVTEWVLRRLLSYALPHQVVIATSSENKNRVIESLAEKYHVRIFSGSEFNVASRFCEIANQDAFSSHYFRVCADNPFISPFLIHRMVEESEKGNFDIIHTMNYKPESTLIDGLGSELISSKAMYSLKVNLENLDKYGKEHVTSIFHTNLEQYKVIELECPEIYSQPGLSLDIDTKQDYEKLLRLIREFQITPDSSDEEIIQAALDSNLFL